MQHSACRVQHPPAAARAAAPNLHCQAVVHGVHKGHQANLWRQRQCVRDAGARGKWQQARAAPMQTSQRRCSAAAWQLQHQIRFFNSLPTLERLLIRTRHTLERCGTHLLKGVWRAHATLHARRHPLAVGEHRAAPPAWRGDIRAAGRRAKLVSTVCLPQCSCTASFVARHMPAASCLPPCPVLFTLQSDTT